MRPNRPTSDSEGSAAPGRASFVGSVFRQGSVYAVGTVLSQGIAFLLFPFFSRVLSPRDYGIIDLLGLLMTLVNVMLADPVSEALGRYFVDQSDMAGRRAYASTALLWTAFLYTTCIGICFAFVQPLTSLLFGPTVSDRIT